MDSKSFFFLSIFKKKFPVFAFLYFTLIETPPTFESAELLQTILDWIRLPLIIVKKIMNSTWSKYLGRTERRGLGEKMKIITIWGTEDDNGLLYVFTARCKKEEGREAKKRNFRTTIRIGCLQSFFFFKTFFKAISG